MVLEKKGDRTRARILNTAEELFIEKGFYAVKMVEIGQRAGLSRSVLYRYFSSTAAVLRGVIQKKSDEVNKAYAEMLERQLSPDQMLDAMLMPKLKELARKLSTIDTAVIEFMSSKHGDMGFAYSHAEEHVTVLSMIIEQGQQSGEYIAVDSRKLARMMLWQIEGMKAYLRFGGLTQSDMEEQLELYKLCIRRRE